VSQQLFESLLIDFFSRGGDDRGGAESLQIGAATRLLYYFPKEAGPIVAKRLRELDVSSRQAFGSPADSDANGVPTV